MFICLLPMAAVQLQTIAFIPLMHFLNPYSKMTSKLIKIEIKFSEQKSLKVIYNVKG